MCVCGWPAPVADLGSRRETGIGQSHWRWAFVQKGQRRPKSIDYLVWNCLLGVCACVVVTGPRGFRAPSWPSVRFSLVFVSRFGVVQSGWSQLRMVGREREADEKWGGSKMGEGRSIMQDGCRVA